MLSRPALLTSLLLLLSTPLSLSTCLPPTQDTPLWTLTDWSTDFTLPDGGSVIFRLSNTLTGYGALCFRRGALPEGQCIWAESGTQGEDDDTQSWFSYDERVRELVVGQGWSCQGGR